MTTPTYHVDGDLVPAEEATVNVRDRGFRYGDAAFETLRVYGGTPFEYAAHDERLRRTCDHLGFRGAVPERDDLRDRIAATLDANGLADASVRLSVTRGVQPGKLTPRAPVDPTVVVTVSSLPRGGTAGDPVWDRPARLQTVETRRIPDAAVPAAAKTHNYLNGILARLELRGTDADEALLCATDGSLAEGATSNLFFVEDGTLTTPATDVGLLPGVTRNVVLDLAREIGVPVETGRYDRERLAQATEVFLTNSTWEVRPVGRLDGVERDAGPVTRRLRQQFVERVDQNY